METDRPLEIGNLRKICAWGANFPQIANRPCSATLSVPRGDNLVEIVQVDPHPADILECLDALSDRRPWVEELALPTDASVTFLAVGCDGLGVRLVQWWVRKGGFLQSVGRYGGLS